MEIRVPFVKKEIGLGSAIKQTLAAVGVKPCGGCNERAAFLNSHVNLKPWKTELPDGYSLEVQGQRDPETQILLGKKNGSWVTWLSDGELHERRDFVDEDSARSDFSKRMESDGA